jgi:hypothetical protein
MKRTHRRYVAWLGILGIAFAQLAVTAHACMISVTTADRVATMAPARLHHDHCNGSHGAPPLAPQANACELQCSDATLATPASDLPPVVLSSLPLPSAPIGLTVARFHGGSFLAANSGAPPPALEFCRLLI